MSAHEEHATAVLHRVDALGLVPVEGARGWPHMGALICDAGLQARANYARTVRPRLLDMMKTWPEATTTTTFAERLKTGDLGEVLRWRGQHKLRIIKEITGVLLDHGIETPNQLRERLAAPTDPVRTALRAIRGVGRKTMDYLSILSGSEQHVAVDIHLRRFAADANLGHLNNADLNAAIVQAALTREWNPGGLDAAIWRTYSTRTK